MHFLWWLPTLRRNLTPYTTLKTEAADCYEITWGHNPERHSFKNVSVSTGWSIIENIYILVVADEKTASQRPVTRPSIPLPAHCNTSPRSWIHSYSSDPSNLISSDISITHITIYTHHYQHKNLHSDRIILHTLKQQPTEAQEAEPNKTKMLTTEKNEMKHARMVED